MRSMNLSRRIAEFPLETGLAAWGFYITVELALGQPPSQSLRYLPNPVAVALGLTLLLASLTVTTGLHVRKSYRTVARGMYLFSATMVAYASVVVGTNGWSRGGAVAGLLLTLGGVCLLRGWWLRDHEAALFKAMSVEGSDD